MTKKELNTSDKRLTIVADFLDKLERDPSLTNGMKWDFSTINDGPYNQKGCGTLGCAMGSLPFIFPKTWEYIKRINEYQPCLKYDTNSWYSVRSFFYLNTDETYHLFYPLYQKCGIYGGKMLPEYARPTEVAANIREFIRLRRENMKKEADCAS